MKRLLLIEQFPISDKTLPNAIMMVVPWHGLDETQKRSIDQLAIKEAEAILGPCRIIAAAELIVDYSLPGSFDDYRPFEG